MACSMSAMYICASASDKRLWVIGTDKHENPAQSGLALMASRQCSSTSGSGQQCASVKIRYFPRALAAPATHRSMSCELDENSRRSAEISLSKMCSWKSGGTTKIISKADLSTVWAFQPWQHCSH